MKAEGRMRVNASASARLKSFNAKAQSRKAARQTPSILCALASMRLGVKSRPAWVKILATTGRENQHRRHPDD
jgi:hypothetical protein